MKKNVRNLILSVVWKRKFKSNIYLITVLLNFISLKLFEILSEKKNF